jgi:hypothetical protein
MLAGESAAEDAQPRLRSRRAVLILLSGALVGAYLCTGAPAEESYCDCDDPERTLAFVAVDQMADGSPVLAALDAAAPGPAGFALAHRGLGPPRGVRAAPAQMMGWFDNAFSNEKFEQKSREGGITRGKEKKGVDVIICGKKKTALPGQRLRDVARGSPIKFNCEDGVCGTCESLVNGRKMRICKVNVPAKGPVKIEPKPRVSGAAFEKSLRR